jgi:hypothetical protein
LTGSTHSAPWFLTLFAARLTRRNCSSPSRLRSVNIVLAFAAGSLASAGPPLIVSRFLEDDGLAIVQLQVGETRGGTKQASLIEMLRARNGASIEEIMNATGWLSHTVRGAIAGALKKRLGLK